MLGKTLILVDEEGDWLSRTMKESGLVDVAQVYREVPYFQKRLRTLHYHTKLSKTYWYDSWKNIVQNYDTVILFDVFFDSDVAEYIEKIAPRARLIVFYRNPWENNYYISEEAKKHCEIWSFDKEDCKNYGLKYNHQFYIDIADTIPADKKYESDILFIGKDKKRLARLMAIDSDLKKAGLNPFIYVVGDRIQYTSEQEAFMHKEHISYEEILKYNKNTQCLLELMQENQVGFTLRTVEAMFFNKKLVTNNPYVKTCDFYDPRNIYVIGKETRSLVDFIKKEPPAAWTRETVYSYSFEHWLQNFE